MVIFNLNNKLIIITVLVLLLFAGIIALTQELEISQAAPNEEKKQETSSAQTGTASENQPSAKPVRWFRSNAGGMALAEMGSRFTALRNEYALSVDFENYKEFPEMLFQYNTGNYNAEIRTLYRKGEILRTQWILRDKNGTTRVNAVIIQPKKEEAQAPAAPEKPAGQNVESGGQMADNSEQLTAGDEQLADNGGQPAENNGQTAENEELVVNNNRRTTRRNRQTAVNSAQPANSAEQFVSDTVQAADNAEAEANGGEQIADNVEVASENEPENAEKAQEVEVTEEKPQDKPGNASNTSQLIGFIEEFDEKSFLTSEVRLYENGSKDRIEYKSKNNLILTATVFIWDDNKKDISAAYTDYYRYNRSLSLRAVEREFLREIKLDEEYFIITFPRRLMDAVNEQFFKSQRQNILPDFFGDVYAQAESRIIYESDDRGRIISQTFYDEDDNLVWAVKNTWSNDRITATTKTEGDNVFTAQYEYAKNGDRISESNYKNGVLERVVRTEGKTDIEELYFKNVLVLRAVWEDGRKISEERIK